MSRIDTLLEVNFKSSATHFRFECPCALLVGASFMGEGLQYINWFNTNKKLVNSPTHCAGKSENSN